METLEHAQHGSRDSVLTVPMRNGNFDYVLGTLGRSIVLTVPMRNGNIASVTFLSISF